jgi:uncharacterized membrane protein YsdA (DUF1294 family)
MPGIYKNMIMKHKIKNRDFESLLSICLISDIVLIAVLQF